MAILCGVNIVYGFLLKASIILPNTGVTPVVACILQILLQAAYLATLWLFTTYVLRDWEVMGRNKYQQVAMRAGSVTHAVGARINALNPVVRYSTKDNEYLREGVNQRSYSSRRRTKGLTGENVLDNLYKNDERRMSKHDKKR